MDGTKSVRAVFNPADPQLRYKLWLRVVDQDENVLLFVFWGRIARMLVVLALAGWLTLTAAYWGYLRFGRGFTGISYVSIVLPNLWPRHDVAMGDNLIRIARARLTTGDPLSAWGSLSAGVQRNPDDLAAWRQLAILCFRLGRKDEGMNTLARCVPHSLGDLEMLKFVFGFLAEDRQHERILGLAHAHLPPSPDRILAHQYLALQAATAHFNLGNFESAAGVIGAWQLERSLEGQLLLARMDWERGLPGAAIARLERLHGIFPDRDELPLELVRFYGELGRPDLALIHARRREFLSPRDPGPRLDVIFNLRALGEQSASDEAVGSYIRDFSGDARSMLLLASQAGNAGDFSTARRIRTDAADSGHPDDGFLIAEIQANVVAGRHAEAGALVGASLAADDSEVTPLTGAISGLLAVACLADGDPGRGEGHLLLFLAQNPLPAEDSLFVSRQLDATGLPIHARRVLTEAARRNPRDEAILEELVRQLIRNPDLDGIETHLPRWLALPKPKREVLEMASQVVGDSLSVPPDVREALQSALARSMKNAAR